MTPAQKLALRASDIRARLAELGGTPDLSDEQNTEISELRNEYADVEKRSAALIVAGDLPIEPVVKEQRSEDRELDGLIAGASIASIFGATLEHRSTEGQTAELQEHFGLSANVIPLELLEVRATGVTAAPSDVGQNQAEIIPAVFPQSCAAFIGVDMPTVPVGEAVYPVLSTSADAGTPAEGVAQDETAGGFTADVLSPSRIQASFFYSREDRARFAGMDSALRMNLSDALSDKLDQQILNGTNGLLQGTNLPNHNVSTETLYALYREQFAYGRVDGQYATSPEDLKVVMGAGGFAHAASQYRGNNDNTDALFAMKAAGVSVKVSAHVPAVAATKQNAVIRLGMRRDMVAPIWQGIQLVPDEITKAAKGEIVITAIMLHAVKILRKAGFYKQQIQVS